MTESRSRLQRLDAITSTAVRIGFYSIWPLGIAVALGATLFAATHVELLTPMFDNRLTAPQRIVGLNYFGGALAGVAAFYLGLSLTHSLTLLNPDNSSSISLSYRCCKYIFVL